MGDWHSTSLEEVYDELGTDEDGLSSDEAEQRLEEHGRNEIESDDGVSPLAILLDQFRDFLIFLLIAAAGVSLFLGEMVDAVLIFIIVVANGVFGFVQDYRAEKSIEALRDMSSPDATVIRDGHKQTIDAAEVVPGDILVIEQGDAIPADARLIQDTELETDESALTGESVQVRKEEGVLDPDTPLAERQNMVYMNTTAVTGRGRAVVTDTGMDTEVGDIAHQLTEADDRETPFQEEVNHLGKRIGYFILAIIALVGVIEFLFTSAEPITVFLVAVSLAVAAVPEGLPAVVTLTLALGSKKMVKKNALVRRLPVVESLGSVNVIVTDKTGTLTENSMTVTHIYFDEETVAVSGTGTSTEGGFEVGGEAVDPADIAPLLRCGLYCNNAEPAPADEQNDFFGDPTEVALHVSAKKAGIEQDAERLREIPFSSERKRMTTIHDEDGVTIAYMKGAPETVLERCDRILIDGEEQDLTEERRQEVLEQNDAFAEEALRVLGFARKRVDDVEAESDEIESGMVFLGLQGMIDPPRSEVQEAVHDCREAGIRVVMATGDNLETAKAIGEEIGFDPAGAMTGNEVEALSDEELQQRVEEVEVFARVSPSHKVRVLQALQANGHNVAMTGDGVNDAPAVKNADVGISMGVRGTDVTKQASDMVLLDDNFVTIRDAIAEGRGIFDNIRKFVNYLLSANAGEVLIVFFGILLGSWFFPDVFQSVGEHEALILTPVMLLWINLLTDGLPALALGADPKDEGIMDRPPRDEGEPVINKRMMSSIVGIGISMTLVGLPLFFYNLYQAPTSEGIILAQTVLFTALVVFEMVRIQLIRQRYNQSIFSNTWLVLAVIASFILQLLVLYTPLNQFFEVTALGTAQWAEIGAAFLGFVALSAGLTVVHRRLYGDGD